MLGKLIKHEFIYLKKTFLPLYAIYALLAFLTKIVIVLADKKGGIFEAADESNEIAAVVFVSLIISAYVMFTFGLGFVTIANNMKRFKNNLFSDEGYLTNTLPVTATEHILSKIISGSANFLVSLVIVLLSVFLLSGESPLKIASVVTGLWDAITDVLTTTAQKISVLLTILFGYIAVMMLGYFMAALESLINLSKGWSGLIGAFCGYFSVVIISRIIGVTVVTMGVDDMATVFFIISGFLALTIGILYALTVYILKHKLNLQ